MKKRLLSLILSLSMAISIIFIPPALAEGNFSQATPNKDILENILNGNRHFVIDTLIGDSGFHTDFSTNPHAIVNFIGDENTMMDNVLTQYQKDKTYKAAVDLMEKIYNSDEYAASITDFITEHAADLLSIFSTDAANFTSDLTYSKSQLNYESILKEVLASDYTSSDGVTLSTKEIELEELERLSKGVKNLKAFADFFKSNASANHIGDDTFDDRMSYYNDYLIPYADNMSSALSTFSELQDTNGKSEERQINDAIAFTTALATLVQMDRYETANDEMSSDIVYYAPTFFVSDDALKIIKQGDKAISTVSKTLSAYMFIEAIATQTNSMKGALTRMSATANPSLKPILQTFANEIGEAGNKKLVGYESLMQYIRNQGVVKEIGKDTAEKLSSKLLKKLEFTNAGLAYTATSKVISGATNVAGITSWCADKAVSFGDTCKKTYELKYLRTLIAQAVSTYKDDLATYQSNKTDENARNVLDDLLLIQKMRLRGETIAYKMTQGQWNSPLGRLLATGTLNPDEMLMDYLDGSYQARVDAFIGASAMPLSTESFTIGNGESMSINYRADAGLYANINKNGKQYSVAELQYKLINGITVNSGGQILVASDVNRNMAIPFIINNGGNVLVANGTKISELTQKSGTTTFGGGSFDIELADVSGGNIQSPNGGTINCGDLKITGTVTDSMNTVCYGNLNLSGKLNGNVSLTGNSTGGGGTLDNLIISGSGAQNISGTLNTTNLTYSNTGTVRQSGTINVSGTAKNTSSKVTGGENTVLKPTGSIYGNNYNCGLTIDGITLDKSMTFGGGLRTQNTVSLSDVNISGGLTQYSGILNLNGGTTVKSDSYFGGTVTQSGGTYYAGGDITVNSTNSFENLITDGKLRQILSGTLNVKNFTNHNIKGLTVSNTVNVSGLLFNSSGDISGLGMTLVSGGKFKKEIYCGDISVIGEECNLPPKITGNAVVSGNQTLLQNVVVEGTLSYSDGTLDLNGSALSCKSDFTNSGTIEGNDSELTLYGLAQNSGTIINCNTSFKKDFVNTGTIDGGIITTQNEILNNGTIKNLSELNLKPTTFLDVGGKSISTADLNLSGKGKVNLKTTINVSGEYTNSGITVNDNNIIISSGKVIDNDRTYKDWNLTTDLTLDNCTVVCDTLNITGAIKLINGAKLIVYKMITANGSSKNIEIDSTSIMEVKKLSSISSYSDIVADGNLIFGGDTVISSSKISGNGTVTLKCDLFGSSLTINKPNNFNIIGKTPQEIQASGANFNNLNISNKSKGGVKFTSSVNCYGNYQTNGSKVTGTVTKK